MGLFITVLLILLVTSYKATSNLEIILKFLCIVLAVGAYTFYCITLENNKKEIEVARQQSLNSLPNLIAKIATVDKAEQ